MVALVADVALVVVVMVVVLVVSVVVLYDCVVEDVDGRVDVFVLRMIGTLLLSVLAVDDSCPSGISLDTHHISHDNPMSHLLVCKKQMVEVNRF